MDDVKKEQYSPDSSSFFESTYLDDSSVQTEQQLDQGTDRNSRSRRVIRLLSAVLLCIVIPIMLYFPLKNSMNVYVALHLSGLVPLMNILHRLAFDRSMDPLGAFVVAEFVASMVVLLLPGDQMDVLARQAWLSIGNAAAFLLSMVPSKHVRPFLFYAFRDIMRVARLIVPHKGGYPYDRITWAWNNLPIYRITVRSLNIMWILIFVVTGGVRLGLIHKSTLPPEKLVHIVKLLNELPLGAALLVTIAIGGVGMRCVVSKHLRRISITTTKHIETNTSTHTSTHATTRTSTRIFSV